MAEKFDIAMPDSLDIGPTYTVRVAALDPTTGAAVAGVTVNTVVLTAELFGSSPSSFEVGQWYLVPGPGA